MQRAIDLGVAEMEAELEETRGHDALPSEQHDVGQLAEQQTKREGWHGDQAGSMERTPFPAEAVRLNPQKGPTSSDPRGM